jgi:hypothetical protein
VQRNARFSEELLRPMPPNGCFGLENPPPVLRALRPGGSLVGKGRRTLFSQAATVMLALPTCGSGLGEPGRDPNGSDARKERAEWAIWL